MGLMTEPMIVYTEERLTLEHGPGYGSVRATVTVFYYLIKRDPAFSMGVRARGCGGGWPWAEV